MFIRKDNNPVVERGHVLEKEIGKEQVLIFLHISKAGGSTLHTILEKQYPGVGHYFTSGNPRGEEKGRWERLSMEERENISVVRGHVNYGVHEFIKKPSVYITMLRNPVERVISHYYFHKRDVGHYLHKESLSENWTLEDFVCKTTENDNGQTRALAGVLDVYSFLRAGQSAISFGGCGREILEIAKSNLRDFAVVGLTERFDESLILLKRTLGWQNAPVYVKENVTADRPRKEVVPQDVLDLIKKHNELDIELYRYATELFENQIKKQDASFQIELKYFKQLNGLYQENHRLKRQMTASSRVSSET